MLYRIITENKNKRIIESIIKQDFDCFTLVLAEGCWDNKIENSLIIEIQGAKYHENRVKRLAAKIKLENDQEKVLIQYFENKSELI